MTFHDFDRIREFIKAASNEYDYNEYYKQRNERLTSDDAIRVYNMLSVMDIPMSSDSNSTFLRAVFGGKELRFYYTIGEVNYTFYYQYRISEDARTFLKYVNFGSGENEISMELFRAESGFGYDGFYQKAKYTMMVNVSHKHDNKTDFDFSFESFCFVNLITDD